MGCKMGYGWKGAALLLFLALLWPSLSLAEMKDHVFKKVLANGLEVLLLENHRVPLITFQIWYRVGSRNEEWGKTGLAHMLEHMMFKGTEKYGPEEFSRIIQENGGNDNAFTSRDYTAYFENLSADRIDVPLELESDRMRNLKLREEDFRTERLVVMEERRMRTEDNPQAVLAEQVEAAAFQISPYHWPIIGWAEDISRFTLEDVRKFHQVYYHPGNAIIVVAGDFKRENLLPKIEKAFGSIPEGPLPNQEKDKDPSQIGERRIIVRKEAQLPSMIMGYHVPNLCDADSYALEVTAAVLADGKSSRFYRRLVYQEQLVRAASAEHSLVTRDPSLFYISADLLPGKEVSEVEKVLEEEVERVKKELVGSIELEKAKNQLAASFVYEQDSLFFQAMLLAHYEIDYKWEAVDDYLPSILKVTPEDIQRVAKRYLIPENRTVGILLPLPAKEGKKPSEGIPLKERIIR